MDQHRQDIYRRDAEHLKQGGGDLPPLVFWYPQVGKNIIRILPPKTFRTDPEAVFYRRVIFHWKVGPNNRRVTCRRSGNPRNVCPVCDISESLVASGRKEDVQLGKDMAGSEKFPMAVIDLNDTAKGVQIFEAPKNIFNEILQLFLDADWGDLDSLTEGHHVKIERTGTGKFDTRYQVIPSPQKTAVNEAWMEKVPDLNAIYAIPDEQYCRDIIEGKEPSPRTTETAATPATTAAAPPPAAAPAPAAAAESLAAPPAATSAPAANPLDISLDVPPPTAAPVGDRAKQMDALRKGL